MPSPPQTSTYARPRGWGRVLAVLAAGSLALAACGTGGATPAADASLGAPAPDGDGPQYGDSLDEFSDAVDADADAASAPTNPDYPDGYEVVTWEDLVPPGFSGEEIYARYEERLAEVEDGSPEADAIYEEMQAEYDSNSGANTDLDGAKINLAGFVAPLNYEDDIVTEFLLVPYFGACIHVPPPPPNQTVLIKVDKADGLTFTEAWGAIWVAGTLSVDSTTTDLATASYRMTDVTSGVYEEFG